MTICFALLEVLSRALRRVAVLLIIGAFSRLAMADTSEMTRNCKETPIAIENENDNLFTSLKSTPLMALEGKTRQLCLPSFQILQSCGSYICPKLDVSSLHSDDINATVNEGARRER